MSFTVEAGSALAQAIQDAVQPKFLEQGWVADESDTTLAEYVTTMVVRGRDRSQIAQELGTDLIGVGADDPGVGEVTTWLFEQVPVIAAQMNGRVAGAPQAQQEEATQDMQMDDVAVPNSAPSGPKAMRDGSAPRGRGRMLGQLNRHMDRNGDDKMLRIKGAAGGTGRINSHSRRDDNRRGRGNGLASGLQRMMGRGGPNGAMGPMDPSQQMQLMQMMEMQNQMMAQMLNGQMPDMSAFGPGMQQNRGKSLFDRVDKRKPRSQNGAGADVEMSEEAKKDAFDTMCRFNDKCTVPSCPFAHQGPVSPPGISVDLTDRCSFGSACQNTKCAGKHPSPAQRRAHQAAEVDCKYFPNCQNPVCPFRHPDMPPCRNGADCTVENCKFSHSKIMCRYNPCLNAKCPYKHVDGQKRGKFEDKVWTADRLKSLGDHSEANEELIIPGNGTNGNENGSNELDMQNVEPIS